jgi:aminoglycoside/choline kinase family phosphotransferase
LLRWFDLMGIQRHLKATGIFARLNYRDGKPGYMNDIPRTLGYVFSVAKNYQELLPFLNMLDDLGIPEKLKQQSTGSNR